MAFVDALEQFTTIGVGFTRELVGREEVTDLFGCAERSALELGW